MEFLVQLIGFACLGHLIADVLSGFVTLPDKPFKCNMCMTFWISITPFIFMYEWQGILCASISAIISEIIYKQLS